MVPKGKYIPIDQISTPAQAGPGVPASPTPCRAPLGWRPSGAGFQLWTKAGPPTAHWSEGGEGEVLSVPEQSLEKVRGEKSPH